MAYLDCDFCGKPEHVDRIKVVKVDPITLIGKPKCYRCRLRKDVRPYWDLLASLEEKVKGYPDDPVAMSALREARVSFEYALRRPQRAARAANDAERRRPPERAPRPR